MTPFRLRLLVVTFFGLAAAISINALYMQDASRLATAALPEQKTDAPDRKKPEPERKTTPEATEIAVQSKPEDAPGAASEETGTATKAARVPQKQPSEIDTALETVATIGTEQNDRSASSTLASTAKPVSPRVIRAIQRELGMQGYDPGPENGKGSPETEAAILSYEFDMGMPLTGKPSDKILKSLLFEASASLPARERRARFEKSHELIAEVQTTLARMGYGASAAHGQLDEATRYAISKFQADRNLESSGRLTARLLVEIMIVTGQPFHFQS